jgi:hypothetical protein
LTVSKCALDPFFEQLCCFTKNNAGKKRQSHTVASHRVLIYVFVVYLAMLSAAQARVGLRLSKSVRDSLFYHILYVNVLTSLSALSIHDYFQVGPPNCISSTGRALYTQPENWMSVNKELQRKWNTSVVSVGLLSQHLPGRPSVKLRKTSLETVSILAQVRTGHHPNTNQNRHSYNHLLRFVLYTETVK